MDEILPGSKNENYILIKPRDKRVLTGRVIKRFLLQINV